MKKLVLASAAALLATAALPAGAAVIRYDLSATVEGTAPSGVPTLTFADTLAGVRLTADLAGLSGDEFVSRIVFNYSGTATNLSFTFNDPLSSGPAAQNVFRTSNGRNTPGNNGLYDLELEFGTSNSGGGINRFDADELVVYDILGPSDLDVSDFNLLSAPEGPQNVRRYALARVQGIGPRGDDSASVADNDGPVITPNPQPVPAPAAIGLFGLGALALSIARRRR